METEKLTILVVDDDSNFMSLVREWLKDEYKVFLTNSGKRALQWLENNKADLMLLDMEMPQLSGMQALQLVRENEKTRDLPVFFLSGKESKDDFVKDGDIKAQDYILKSSGRAGLIDAIRNYFGDSNLAIDEQKGKDSASPILDVLSGIEGISVDEGLEYCGRPEFLEKFLKTFLRTIDDKSKEIEEAFVAKDYENYIIRVHGLKSTSRMIGAKELSALALELEMAGKNKDYLLIEDKTKLLLEFYRSYKEKLEILS